MAQATITTAYIAAVQNAQDGLAPDLGISYFKIAEGGWRLAGASKVPRTPDPLLSDVDALANPGRYPLDSRYVFQKSITPDRINITGANFIEIECFVDTSEANDDGFGNPPEFWEIGVFDADGTLVAYVTFDKQTKDDRRALRHLLTIQRTIV
jgi:hypothetical protein